MSEPKTNRIPAPIYAAAGAGELAIEQLRKLPAVVGVLGTRVVADLGGRAVLTGYELRQKANELDLAKLRESADLAKLREAADLAKLREVADLDKLRAAATRNAAMVIAGAQVAQERAFAAYGALVARGERVVGAGVLEAADTVNADIEATQAVTPAETTPAATATTAPAEVPTPADVAEIAEAKPAAVKKVARAPKAAKPAATPSAKLPRATKRTRPAAE
jgi:heparin binding hemagglutinin HbhA